MPRCIGIIMDGNRRWAKQKGLLSHEGHLEGVKTLHKITHAIFERDIQHLVVYAFSIENWQRSKEEVEALMNLFSKVLSENNLQELLKENVKLKVIGQIQDLPESLKEAIKRAESKNENAAYTLWIALSYGGRLEILEAARKSADKYGENLNESDFTKELWSYGMPDPDIVIRTGGEKRLSNFLLWQIAYSELFFTDTYWPDFDENELDDILMKYKERKRRFGK